MGHRPARYAVQRQAKRRRKTEKKRLGVNKNPTTKQHRTPGERESNITKRFPLEYKISFRLEGEGALADGDVLVVGHRRVVSRRVAGEEVLGRAVVADAELVGAGGGDLLVLGMLARLPPQREGKTETGQRKDEHAEVDLPREM